MDEGEAAGEYAKRRRRHWPRALPPMHTDATKRAGEL